MKIEARTLRELHEELNDLWGRHNNSPVPWDLPFTTSTGKPKDDVMLVINSNFDSMGAARPNMHPHLELEPR